MMRAKEPTFWLLDGRNSWNPSNERLPQSSGVTRDRRAGIRLAADPSGSLGLRAADGSLGGLVLPRGMAVSRDGELLLLVRLEAPQPGEMQRRVYQVKRFDRATQRFEALPFVGSVGRDPRQFHRPQNIAIAGRNLYVADSGNRRVQVFDLNTLALRHVWKQARFPVDVTAQGNTAYILDRRGGQVYRHRVGQDALVPLFATGDLTKRWSRIAVDREERIYLLNAAGTLDIFDRAGRHLGQASDAGDLRDRFDAPPLRLDHLDRFCIPESLAHPCAPATTSGPAPDMPLALCPPGGAQRLIFDRQGQAAPMAPFELAGPKLYATGGTWFSAALDSQIYRCQWHRIELELLDLPPGTQVIVSTYADGQLGAVPEAGWETCYNILGPVQSNDPRSKPELKHEFLVQSREGQFLWLRVQLTGDGYATPAVGAMRVHYPRDSYVQYLPAVYSADNESRWFLERFLSVFQTEWDTLEQSVDDIAGLFDPTAVRAGPELEYLASWLALPLEGEWNTDQQRRLLRAAPAIYPKRGTLAGLQALVRVYAENMHPAAHAQDAATGFPLIVEGFRERRRLLLGAQGVAELGANTPLWGPAQVGRLQLDVFDREGDVRLVSLGDPPRDLFAEHAHRFRVYVPATWLRTAADERMLRRAIEAEKPAHTRYELCLVEARYRVGLQSTVGIDTIIGAYPQARLACVDDPNAPPSQALRGILGYDTVLGGASAGTGGLALGPTTRIGIDTRLT